MYHRSSVRVQTDLLVKVHADGYDFACRAVDLSPDGIVIERARGLLAHQARPVFWLELPIGPYGIVTLARPAWDRGAAQALRFIDISHADRLLLAEHMEAGRSFVAVNTASVAEEEVKYTLDDDGFIKELSKRVTGGLGEAVGINYIAADDKATLVQRLEEADDQDYFKRGIELAIEKGGLRVEALDISQFHIVEVDFDEDLTRANEFVGE